MLTSICPLPRAVTKLRSNTANWLYNTIPIATPAKKKNTSPNFKLSKLHMRFWVSPVRRADTMETDVRLVCIP
jgi:hypothetical protein